MRYSNQELLYKHNNRARSLVQAREPRPISEMLNAQTQRHREANSIPARRFPNEKVLSQPPINSGVYKMQPVQALHQNQNERIEDFMRHQH